MQMAMKLGVVEKQHILVFEAGEALRKIRRLLSSTSRIVTNSARIEAFVGMGNS
jgi:hypothetical protein